MFMLLITACIWLWLHGHKLQVELWYTTLACNSTLQNLVSLYGIEQNPRVQANPRRLSCVHEFLIALHPKT